MNNFDGIKKMNEKEMANLIMQFIKCSSKTHVTSVEMIEEWLKGNSMFLPFKDVYPFDGTLGDTE